MSNSDHLHERLRQMKARAAIQKWEARQVDLAGGVWFHLQLLLASTRRALVITADEAAVLRNGGFEPHPIGARLEPPRSFFVLSEEMVPVGVGSEVPLQEAQRILLAPAAILIPFRNSFLL
jgi:hypothetical protein